MSDPETSTAVTAADLMDAVAAAPEGPQVGAFFDFDGTVIAGYSVTAFMRPPRQEPRPAPAHDARHAGQRLAGPARRGGLPQVPRHHAAHVGGPDARGAREDRQPALPRRDRPERLPGGVAPDPPAPGEGPHGRPRQLGHPVPGRAGREGPGRRAHDLHGRRGRRGRHAHRAPRRPLALRRGQGRGGQGVRGEPTTSTWTRASRTPTAARTSRSWARWATRPR